MKIGYRKVPILTYAALLLGAAVFSLPFLWMVSSSFKTLETIFEYPPSLLPTEPQVTQWQGRRVKVGEQTLPSGARQKVLLLNQRPGFYRVMPFEEAPMAAGFDRSSMATGDSRAGTAWVASASLRPVRLIRFHTENYPRALSDVPFARFALNTLLITVSALFGQLLSASLVAFAFARLEWPGRNLLFLLVLATMMLPQEVTMIPTYLIFRQLGWIDTFLPLIVPSFLGGGAFSIFLFRQFFLTLPRELDEAARVDGCGSFTLYWRVLMPLCKPILATLAVFGFVAHWNDFMTPLIYLNSSEKFTLAVGLRFFQGEFNTDMHLLMAASTLVLLPVLAVFFLGQKHFVKSIVLTGIKG